MSMKTRNKTKTARALIASLAMVVSSSALADSGLTFSAYGKIKLDAIYDTLSTNNGDVTLMVRPQPASGSNTNQFLMTANHSLFGIDVAAPDAAGAKVNGKIEIDFYNPVSGIDNRPAPELKQGWLKADWSDSKFTVIAGQQWDTIVNLNLMVLNYGYNFFTGMAGFRRPGLRLTKGFDIGSTELTVDAEITRSTPSDTNLQGFVSGADSNAPGYQGKISYGFHLLGDKNTVVAVKAASGRPRVFDGVTAGAPNNSGANYYTANLWLVGGDLNFPIMNGLRLVGSYQRGSDLRGFGSLSVANYATQNQTAEESGWAQVQYQMTDTLWLGAGMGYAFVTDAQDSANGALIKQEAPMLTAKYWLSKEFSVGAEFMQYTSTYKTSATVNSSYMDNHYQTSVMLNF